jgi:hypothetical protein
MNGNPMYKARVALTLHPGARAIAELQDAPAGTRHRIWLVILAALPRGRAVGKRSGINPQFRHLRGLPGQGPGDPSTGRPIRGPA